MPLRWRIGKFLPLTGDESGLWAETLAQTGKNVPFSARVRKGFAARSKKQAKKCRLPLAINGFYRMPPNQGVVAIVRVAITELRKIEGLNVRSL